MSKLWIENIEVPAVVYQLDSPGENFTDQSNNIEAWDTYGVQVLQYMHVHRKLQALIISIVTPYFTNWGGLTGEQKVIAARWIIAPYALRLTQQTDGQDKENWIRLIDRTQGWGTLQFSEGRAYVIEQLRVHVGDYLRREVLTRAQADAFYYDVKDLIEAYIFANVRDFYKWLTNEVGSVYEGNGFAQKSYWSQQLEDELTTIYNAYY